LLLRALAQLAVVERPIADRHRDALLAFGRDVDVRVLEATGALQHEPRRPHRPLEVELDRAGLELDRRDDELGAVLRARYLVPLAREVLVLAPRPRAFLRSDDDAIHLGLEHAGR